MDPSDIAISIDLVTARPKQSEGRDYASEAEALGVSVPDVIALTEYKTKPEPESNYAVRALGSQIENSLRRIAKNSGIPDATVSPLVLADTLYSESILNVAQVQGVKQLIELSNRISTDSEEVDDRIVSVVKEKGTEVIAALEVLAKVRAWILAFSFALAIDCGGRASHTGGKIYFKGLTFTVNWNGDKIEVSLPHIAAEPNVWGTVFLFTPITNPDIAASTVLATIKKTRFEPPPNYRGSL
jgi:hypothetical protein